MEKLILAILYWLHLLATVTWIGGIIFVLFVALPSAKEVLGTDAGKMMTAVTKRFTPLANYSILLLVLTGVALTVLSERFTGVGTLNTAWTIALVLKHFLVLVMILVHFYRGLVLAPKIVRRTFTTEKASLQKLSLNLVKVNFVLGIGVLLLSGVTSVI